MFEDSPELLGHGPAGFQTFRDIWGKNSMEWLEAVARASGE
jgi:hypothetical protein